MGHYNYLNNLNLWLEEALTSPHSWFYSNAAIVQLLESGRYPSSKLLQDWLRRYRGLDINIRQISNWVNQFFNKEFDLGIALEKRGYLVDLEVDSIVILPDQLTSRWPNFVGGEMQLLLATVCACKHMGESFAYELNMATSKLIEAKKEVQVSAVVSASIPEYDWETDKKFTETLPLLFTPDDLPAPTNIISLWDEGEKGIRYAIDYWYQHDWQSAASTALQYSFGPHFLNSITEAKLNTQELVLTRIVRAVAAVIANQAQEKNYNLRPLRESETADDPQRIRSGDDAKAWRLTVTPGKAGWRMHYWKAHDPDKGSIIEFANVLKKGDPEEIY